MEWGINFLGELEKMKREMDRTWNDLVENTPEKREEETSERFERLPKFEGKGRRSLKSSQPK
jgi:hypothetical protein